MITIAVTAVGGGAGQSVLRALKCSQMDLRLVGLDADPWSPGLFCVERGYLVPHSVHANEYIRRLEEIVREEEVDLVIPGSDPEIEVLSRFSDRISCDVVVGSARSVQLSRDKLMGSRFFRSRGFPFAETLPLENLGEILEIPFPIVVKPRSGSASSGVVLAFESTELQEIALRRPGDICQPYLIPASWGVSARLGRADLMSGGRLVQKDEVSIQILVGSRGGLLGTFTSLNMLRDGVPMRIEPIEGGESATWAEKMALALAQEGFRGPCNFQCRVTREGPVFFEVNPRFTGITAMRAALGFNECEAVVRDLVLKQPEGEIRRGLLQDTSHVCSRFITECIIPKDDLNGVRRDGSVEGRGRPTSL